MSACLPARPIARPPTAACLPACLPILLLLRFPPRRRKCFSIRSRHLQCFRIIPGSVLQHRERCRRRLRRRRRRVQLQLTTKSRSSKPSVLTKSIPSRKHTSRTSSESSVTPTQSVSQTSSFTIPIPIPFPAYPVEKRGAWRRRLRRRSFVAAMKRKLFPPAIFISILLLPLIITNSMSIIC